MKARRSRALTYALIGIALTACVALVLALAALFLRIPDRGPDVVMRSPLHGDQVSLQQGVLVQAIARDRQGVTRIEFWVDGQLLAAASSEVAGGSTPFPLSELWLPSGEGTHTLTARAFDRGQKSGQSTVVVEVVNEPKPAPADEYEVQAGDTLEDIAARHGLALEELTEANPGVTDPLTSGEAIHLPPPPADREGPRAEEPAPAEPLPGETPPDPLITREISLTDLILRPFVTFPRGRLVGVEGLSLEVDKAYDGVYCYLSLASLPFERVPAEGYLEGRGENMWGIEDWAAGDRMRVVRLAEGVDSLDFEANCLGYRGTPYGGEAFDLGTIAVRHPRGEWDGREFQQTGSGDGGWFRVTYRIYPPPYPEGPLATPIPGEPEPPYMPQPILYKDCSRRWLAPAVSVIDEGRVLPPTWFVTCELGIDYGGAAEGFLLLRDGAILQDIPTGRWEVAITLTGWQPSAPLATIVELDGTAHPVWPDTGDLPPPGETYEFQVIAYVGDPLRDPPAGWRSPPSNIVEIGSDIWAQGRNVRVTLYEFDTGCLHADESGFETWGWGPREVDAEGHPDMSAGCDDDLDEWGLTTGGVSVNGDRVFSLNHYIHSGRRYPLARTFYFSEPAIELYLGPSDALTVSMRLWEDDVWSDAEAICHGNVTYSPPELEAIQDGPGALLVLGQAFASYYGDCYLTYNITILP